MGPECLLEKFRIGPETIQPYLERRGGIVEFEYTGGLRKAEPGKRAFGIYNRVRVIPRQRARIFLR
jgi:hypothetical protein